MQKVIERATLMVVQAMEKNRKAYAEAQASYNDTGYDRYWNKMQRLDKEYDEFKSFLGPDNEEMETQIGYARREIKELKRFIKDVKSAVDYIHADYWGDTRVNKLHEKLKGFVYREGQ